MKAIALLVLVAFTLQAQVPCRWDVNLPLPAVENLPVWRGESISLQPRFLLDHAAYPVPTGSTVYLYWSTNNFATQSWITNGQISATETGRVIALWTPTCDVGAWQYQYFVGVTEPSGLLYRARGTLTMHDSPGWHPIAAPLPVWDGWMDNYIYAPWSAVRGIYSNFLSGFTAGSNYTDTARTSAVAQEGEALGASGTLWRIEWQAADVTTLSNANSTLSLSGGVWRLEWQQEAGASAEVVRVALTNEAAIRAAQDALLQAQIGSNTAWRLLSSANYATNAGYASQAGTSVVASVALGLTTAGSNAFATAAQGREADGWAGVSNAVQLGAAAGATVSNYLTLSGGTMVGTEEFAFGYDLLFNSPGQKVTFRLDHGSGNYFSILFQSTGHTWLLPTPGVDVTFASTANITAATAGVAYASQLSGYLPTNGNVSGLSGCPSGAVSTNDLRVINALTNPAQFATAAQGTNADTAVQPATLNLYTTFGNSSNVALSVLAGAGVLTNGALYATAVQGIEADGWAAVSGMVQRVTTLAVTNNGPATLGAVTATSMSVDGTSITVNGMSDASAGNGLCMRTNGTWVAVFTNNVAMHDGTLNGTNGVFFTCGTGTNYWILFP